MVYRAKDHDYPVGSRRHDQLDDLVAGPCRRYRVPSDDALALQVPHCHVLMVAAHRRHEPVVATHVERAYEETFGRHVERQRVFVDDCFGLHVHSLAQQLRFVLADGRRLCLRIKRTHSSYCR